MLVQLGEVKQVKHLMQVLLREVKQVEHFMLNEIGLQMNLHQISYQMNFKFFYHGCP